MLSKQNTKEKKRKIKKLKKKKRKKERKRGYKAKEDRRKRPARARLVKVISRVVYENTRGINGGLEGLFHGHEKTM